MQIYSYIQENIYIYIHISEITILKSESKVILNLRMSV